MLEPIQKDLATYDPQAEPKPRWVRVLVRAGQRLVCQACAATYWAPEELHWQTTLRVAVEKGCCSVCSQYGRP